MFSVFSDEYFLFESKEIHSRNCAILDIISFSDQCKEDSYCRTKFDESPEIDFIERPEASEPAKPIN